MVAPLVLLAGLVGLAVPVAADNNNLASLGQAAQVKSLLAARLRAMTNAEAVSLSQLASGKGLDASNCVSCTMSGGLTSSCTCNEDCTVTTCN